MKFRQKQPKFHEIIACRKNALILQCMLIYNYANGGMEKQKRTFEKDLPWTCVSEVFKMTN